MLQQQTSLLVSNDPTARARARSFLVPGRRVDRVATYSEALAILFSEGMTLLPSQVLVDSHLPDGRGEDLVRRVRQDPWLRRATQISLLPPPEDLSPPHPEPEESVEELSDEDVMGALQFAGIP